MSDADDLDQRPFNVDHDLHVGFMSLFLALRFDFGAQAEVFCYAIRFYVNHLLTKEKGAQPGEGQAPVDYPGCRIEVRSKCFFFRLDAQRPPHFFQHLRSILGS